jgi:putative endonuclease
MAEAYLIARGLRLIAMNWHCPWGELDLVMLDGEELVFVEVKTRRGEGAGRPGEAVSATKGRRLLRAAESFIDQHPDMHDRIWRVDLVAITLSGSSRSPRIAHHVNAIVAG